MVRLKPAASVSVIALLFLAACRSAIEPTDSRDLSASPGLQPVVVPSVPTKKADTAIDVQSIKSIDTSDSHKTTTTLDHLKIPQLVDTSAVPDPSRVLPATNNASVLAPLADTTDLYTVIADQVPVREILHSIARDADAKVSFVGDVDGDISLTLINQPLELILQQISAQVPVRYELRHGDILLLEDKPFIRTYEVDYLNMQRLSESRVDLATRIGSITTNIEDSGTTGAIGNGSQLFVENKSTNNVWESVIASVSGILDEPLESGKSGSANVFVNPESGLISVRAREKQHQSIAQLLESVTHSVQRQVLIEATVVEVTLSDQFESGIDWQVLNDSGDESFQFSQILGGLPEAAEAIAPVTALFSYSNADSILGNLSATLKLLQQFGEVQVLSNPKIIAMNNQPAVLKVVDNRVYFTFEVDRLERENGDERTVVDSTVHSVPIGLVMSVTPFISRDHEVILNVRPTLSRILNFAEDPSPALAGQSQVRNLIPEIQVREMESLLRVQSGDVAIIGGLMQNKTDSRTNGVPGLMQIPLFGRLFSHEIKNIEKTELLVFLKPTVMNSNTSVNHHSLLQRRQN